MFVTPQTVEILKVSFGRVRWAGEATWLCGGSLGTEQALEERDVAG